MEIVTLTFFLLLISVYSFRKDKKKYLYFQSLSSTSARQKAIKKMVLESFLIYGILGVLSLFLIGHSTALIEMPNFLLEYSRKLWSFGFGDNQYDYLTILKIFLLFLIPLILFSGPVFTLFSIYSYHRKNKTKDPQTGDENSVSHLLPQNSRERFWIVLMSINAGFSEEVFF